MWRLRVSRVASAALVVVLLLSGCSVGSNEPKVTENTTTEPTNELNMFEQGCSDFESGLIEHKYLAVYEPILKDICQDFEMKYELVEVITSPKVDPAKVEYYVDANVFGLSYWDRYVENGMTKRYLVLLMEEEQDWWSEQLDQLLIIEPTWFGPSAEAGHCYAAEPEAFCPKLYVGNEGDTKGDYDVLTTMLGSKMQWTTFRRVVPIHEATHGFQTATQLGHWRYWYVEGQATYFELAASVLVPDLRGTNWRDEQLIQSHANDEHRFNAKTVDEVVQYMYDCDYGKKRCDGFRYLGASFAHQLLVNAYGVETYLAWNLALAEQLPDFNWKVMHERPDDVQRGTRLFATLFEEFFGLDLETWEREVFAPYVLEHYSL